MCLPEPGFEGFRSIFQGERPFHDVFVGPFSITKSTSTSPAVTPELGLCQAVPGAVVGSPRSPQEPGSDGKLRLRDHVHHSSTEAETPGRSSSRLSQHWIILSVCCPCQGREQGCGGNCTLKSGGAVGRSQNHGGWKRALRSPSPTFESQHGVPHEVGFGHFQGWGLPHCQSVPGLSHSPSEGISPDTQPELPWLMLGCCSGRTPGQV